MHVPSSPAPASEAAPAQMSTTHVTRPIRLDSGAMQYDLSSILGTTVVSDPNARRSKDRERQRPTQRKPGKLREPTTVEEQ
eukprot:5029672-Amphidinium_carterae.1